MLSELLENLEETDSSCGVLEQIIVWNFSIKLPVSKGLIGDNVTISIHLFVHDVLTTISK